ncbi:alpha/beta fold hydrolase [Xanthovirga aplysinae]|uniref:alpha/beta fold hydrolase n=1 Tax=Xanthovirga aplysinae TaxID=2529853 RepID=UPI0012BBC29E|nr:alpha/beta hydrolase [Xanthovirga aplysinae]MTI31146.1 alpha/beta hydrolase [Xanthovirga aplysinae]
MFRIIKWFIISLFIMAIGGTVIYYGFPLLIINAVKGYHVKQAGLSDKTIQLGQYSLPYYEGGEGDTLILIHGFGDNKYSFIPLAKFVSPNYHVLLPEVPGFGETARLLERNHSIRGQVEALHQFILEKKLSKFHLAGNSMGGHIAAAYTLAYPEYVDKLILLNAAGLLVNGDSVYHQTKVPLKNYSDFDVIMDKLFEIKPDFPNILKDDFIEKSAKSFQWQNQIIKQIHEGKDYILNDRIHQIQQHTLIIWGRQDKIVKFAIGEAYHKGIPNSEIYVFDPGGHVPHHEYTEKTAQIMLNFLND